MPSITNFNKKKHPLIRSSLGGDWVDGEYIDTPETTVYIYANIQPAFAFNQTKLLPEGDRDKEAIWGSSNQWVYPSRSSGASTIQADVVLYRGSKWEVKGVMPYLNSGEHCEFAAIKINDIDIPRLEGGIGSNEDIPQEP